MDPDANLEELRELVDRLVVNNEEGYMDSGDCERALELVRALDEWLSKGGALPEAWARKS